MRRIGLGVGLIATILLPLALLLFSVLKPLETLSAILLLSGLWALVFGVMMENKQERLYYSGFGAIVAILSTFHFISLEYTAGLVLVAFVALALIQAIAKPGTIPRM
ncbi:MAG: hypothetical protein ACRD6W_10135 [Nitrososphaerales archaeon]